MVGLKLTGVQGVGLTVYHQETARVNYRFVKQKYFFTLYRSLYIHAQKECYSAFSILKFKYCKYITNINEINFVEIYLQKYIYRTVHCVQCRLI